MPVSRTTKNKNEIFMGIDPGTKSMGIGIVERTKAGKIKFSTERIQPPPKAGNWVDPGILDHRLTVLANSVGTVARRYQTYGLIAMEAQMNVKGRATILNQLEGAIMVRLRDNLPSWGVHIIRPYQQTWKGFATSKKSPQLSDIVLQLYKDYDITLQSEDEAVGLWLAFFAMACKYPSRKAYQKKKIEAFLKKNPIPTWEPAK